MDKNCEMSNEPELTAEEFNYLLFQMFRVDLKNKVEITKEGVVFHIGNKQVRVCASVV